MNSQELFDWLTFFHDDSIPLSLLRELLLASAMSGDWRQLQDDLASNHGETERLLLNALQSPVARTAAQMSIRWSEAGDNHLLFLTDSRYPRLLSEIADPPPLLFVRGNVECTAFTADCSRGQSARQCRR